MKLSEAIRLGAMLKPQGFGDYEFDGGTCAFGAAFDALGRQSEDCREMVEWPWLYAPALCPAGCSLEDQRGEIIVHLNDGHRWTREQIADWVETIEPQPEAPAIETPVHVHAV